mgnify:CR=1 FL=1
MIKIITDQNGKKGFNFHGTFITDPYTTECMRSIVDPIEYYGLTEDQLKMFEHLKPKEPEPEPTTDELIEKLKGMKFFIVYWCGAEGTPRSDNVEDPLTFFNQNFWGDDVLKDLADMEVGQKYNVDEIMQDFEILRYE